MWKWTRCGLVPRGPPNGLKVAASSPSPPAWRPPPPTPIHPAVSAGDGGSPFCRAVVCTASPLGPQPLKSNQLNLDLAGHWSSPLTLPLSHLIAAVHRVCPTQVVGPWVLDTSQTSPASLFLCLSCPPLRLSQILPPWGSCLQTPHTPGLPWRPWCPSTTRLVPGVHRSLSFV